MVANTRQTNWVAFIIAALLVLGILRELNVMRTPHTAAPRQSQSTVRLQDATQLPTPKAISAFNLIDEQGQPATEAVFKDQWGLIFLGFTNCPDICPATLTILQKAYATERLQNIRFTFISGDPARDTPEALQAFLSPYHADFHGLTGTTADITALAQSLGLYTSDADGQGNITHSGTLLVTNPLGEVVALFSQPRDVNRIIHDIEVLQGKRMS